MGTSMLFFYASRPLTMTLAVLALSAAMAVGPPIAMGQIPTAETDQDVALVVDGRVQKVYRDGDQCLVQILVRKSEMPRLSAVAGVRYPAPGELVYAHVDLQNRGIDRVVRRSGAKMLPDPNSPIRAFLTAGQNGRWEAVGRDWFEENPTNNDVAWSDRWPRDRSTPDRAGRDAASLGVETQRNGIGRGNGLKVVQVRPDMPQQKPASSRVTSWWRSMVHVCRASRSLTRRFAPAPERWPLRSAISAPIERFKSKLTPGAGRRLRPGEQGKRSASKPRPRSITANQHSK